jgi:tryptophanyl-tRNA synthetase
MSKSYDNAINLSDPPEVVRKKCMGMFTDPTRIRRTDPGHPESCNLFEFHKLVSPPELRERVAHDCRAALIGCVDDKKLIAEQIVAMLEPIQRRRAELLRDRGSLLSILRTGSERAAERARATMTRVRGALGMDYAGLLKNELH